MALNKKKETRGTCENIFDQYLSVPNDLESVIHHKDEVPAELGGMSEQQVQKSGKVLSHSTKPKLSAHYFCLRRQGKILLNRSIGYAQGNSPAGLQENALIATPDTPVCLFSASKMITAMLIHLLDEKAKSTYLTP